MIMNFIVAALLLVITLLWGIRGKGRGLFSSMLTFLCVLIAGAVAFGVWEWVTTAYLLDQVEGMAWGLGLAVPFVLTLGILRLIVELSVPKNVKVDDLSNFVGGSIFGFGSGVITTGILVISVTSVNFGPDLLGYKPIGQDGGNLSFEKPLWVPVDAWTTKLYEYLSLYSFGTGDEALALRRPNVNEHVVLNALVYAEKTDEGQTLARNAFADGDVRVASMYRGDQLDDFLVSTTAGSAPLDVRGIDGQDVDAGATMAGFVLVFNASAKESGGQVVVGPGQVRLIYQDERTGRAGAAHPHAIVSDPEVNAGSKIWYPRKTPDLFIPSVGGENEAVMAFEFALPANAKPVDLIVKNLRLELSGWVPSDPEAVRTFTSSSDRDVAIVSGELFSGTGAGGSADLDRSKAVRVSGSDSLARSAQMGGNRVINSTTGIPGSLQVNADNAIVDGAAQIRNQDLTGNRGLDRALRIDRFATTPDTAILQIILSSGGERSPLGRIVESEGLNGRPFIIDEQGRTYDAVGYIYSDGRITYIKFEPGNPLGAMSEIEGQLSISTRDQTLILLFRPSQGVTITGFAVGDTLVGEMSEQMR